MNIDKKPTKDMKAELYDKVLGSLAGFVIGDAMGATTEFMDKESIKAKYGRVENVVGGGWLNLKPGDVTDDTQMMMCIVQVFLNNGNKVMNMYRFKNEVASNFVKWYKSNPPDIGNTCRAGIEYYIKHNKFTKTNNQAQGNGGLMRALPCYIMNNIQFNYAQNDITHNNSICREFIKAYHETMDRAMSYNQSEQKQSMGSFGMMEPTGRVHNTFYNARVWGMCSDTFEDAIIGAVNDGGDADTIAALAGSIAGIRFGFGSMPYRWVDTIDKDLLDKLCKFADLAINIL